MQTVNLDEYCGLSGENPNSYRYFMNDNLFDHVNIDKANTHVPNGFAEDLEAEAARYESFIESLGGVDLKLLGIGHSSHIGFNEPTDHFPTAVHTVALTESTINANARLFERREDVPTQAITMGIGTIMKADKILLIAGADKKAIVEKAFYGPVTPEVPASVLQAAQERHGHPLRKLNRAACREFSAGVKKAAGSRFRALRLSFTGRAFRAAPAFPGRRGRNRHRGGRASRSRRACACTGAALRRRGR